MKTFIFKFLFSVFFLVSNFEAFAQVERKYGFELEQSLQLADKNELIPLLIELNRPMSKEEFQLYQAKVRLQIDLLYSIEIPAKNIPGFAKLPRVKKIEYSLAKGTTLSDSMLLQVNADSVHQGHSPLPQNYSGKDVIIGVIDGGIELNHPDFQDSLGNTRVLYIWDQGVAFNPNRQANQYTYGVEWDAASIDSNISTHDDNPNEFGHGSNVTGAAASNGLAKGNFRGVAPDANIITVATDFSKANWLQTVAEAVDYIYAKADSLGLPCVINASIGTYAGGHDGKDIAARMIDKMIKAKKGRSFVCAAGNAATIPFHLQHQLQNDTAFTWFVSNPSQWNGQGGLFFTLWADTADFADLQFSIGADEVLAANQIKFSGRTAFDSITNRLNVLFQDSIIGSSGKRIAKVSTFAEKSQGRYKIEVAIINPDSANYRFRLESRGSGKFDLWSSWSLFRHSDMLNKNLPNVQQFPEMVHYQKPDSIQTIVSSFTCLPSVITVGNYVNRSSYIDVSGTPRQFNVQAGEISINSSLGPNRLGDLKPDISSAGDLLFSAGRLATIQSAIQTNPAKVSQDSMHFRNGGTSMASPTVAGMVALYLEKCPNASYLKIQQDLFAAAKKDSFTVNLPNNKWGRGKADAFKFLGQSNFSPAILSPTPTICEGDSIFLKPNNSELNYFWHDQNGEVPPGITKNGQYYALVEDSSGCKATTDTVSINFSPRPTKVLIRQNRDTLLLNPIEEVDFQWFFNQQILTFENDSFLVGTKSGDYFCQLTDSIGCSTNSDTITLLITGLQDIEKKNNFRIGPNPSNGNFKIEFNPETNVERISLHDIRGRKIKSEIFKGTRQQIEVKWSPLSKGIYFLKIYSNSNQNTVKLIIH